MKSSTVARPSRLLMFEGLVLTIAVLYLAKQVIIPLALAILLTFVLTPIVVAVQRCGLGRVPAVLAVVCLTFLFLGGVGWGVGLQVQRLVRDLPTHTEEIKRKIDSLRGSGDGAIARLIQMMEEISNAGPEQAVPGKSDAANTPAPPAEPSKDRQVIIAESEKPSAIERLSKVAEPVLEPLALAGLVIILVVFMLINREDLRNRVLGLLGHGHLTGTTRVLVDTAERLSSFLLSQLLVNSGFGIVFGITLFFLGVPYAFLWAFLTTLLRFVPYVGSWIALAFPLVLSFAIAPGWTQPVLVLSSFAVFDVVTANVVEPLVFGHSTGVAPIALLIAAAFWSWLWGPIGLVLSTPLTVCLVVLGQHIPRFKFLTLLLGDQPALAPHASYYQRLLARDRGEAKEVAQQYVASHGLDKVFDDVFLPALALTRRDRQLGGLTAEEEEFIYQATREIVDQLPSEPGTASDPVQTDAGATPSPRETKPRERIPGCFILGCPSHHEAEELSLLMLDRLLNADEGKKEGATSSATEQVPFPCVVDVVSTRVLPAEIEVHVEQEKPALVFIAILPPGGLVQAGYLCKRLRKRFARLPIIVGYWGEVRDFDKLLVRLRLAGASYVTTSLLQTRSQIRALIPTPTADKQAPVLQASGGREDGGTRHAARGEL